MNVLSKLLDKAASVKEIGYHPKCQTIGLTHLSFADDIMVLTDGQIRSVEGIITVFDEFSRMSGLKISMEKSTIFLVGVSETVKLQMSTQFGFESGSFPVRYLGLPLLTKRMSPTDYLPLLEKIRQKITSWKTRPLSFAGRLALINSVLMSLTNFWLSAFKLPSACLKQIEQLCSAFLWSGPSLNPHKAKLSWTEICKPKAEGGLGLRPLKEINMVSCLKMIWVSLPTQQSLQHSRRRIHRAEHLQMIENVITEYRGRVMHGTADIPLWKHSNDVYKPSFSSKKTWVQLREAGPVMDWHKGIWFFSRNTKVLLLCLASNP
ncbi:unnamed protein product [Microthlaspi erraticum]|uniref:Reverse transcriptase domain-containing protein n=1 Tax=Microthlaspi erraticum TaxID=1685480 RepID=A0A6D2J9E3_9BRAS|nr:unnamed protein product [Microthlaspi erraticum]